MGKGDVIQHEFVEFRDPLTGAAITRLTSPDKLHHHPYFYNKMVTNDNRYLFFTRENKIIRMEMSTLQEEIEGLPAIYKVTID